MATSHDFRCTSEHQPHLEPLEVIRIHRGAAHLHHLGLRVLAEALIELVKGPMTPSAVLNLLGRYNHLTRDQVVAAGADQPLHHNLMVVP